VEVIESRGCGITFDGKNEDAEARDNRIVGCRITGCGSHGIKILRAHHTVVDGCVVWGNGGKGIIIEKSQNDADQPNAPSEYNVVTNCQVFENDEHGIYIRSSHYNQITDNTVQNNGQASGSWDGIRVIADDGIDAIGNIIRGNVSTDDQPSDTQQYGVKLTVATTGAVDYTVISDNYLQGNASGAISDGGTNTLPSNNAQ
jgi:parallel beta-helix repeat protein